MRSRITLAALALAAAPLAAQQSSALPTSPAARVVATYDFRNAPRDVAFPTSVTVADSAGTIRATVALAGNTSRTVPMEVTVIESNLILQGMTPEGVLTLVLDRQNEGGTTRLASGTWTLGKYQGQLRGQVQP
ncbi:MAG: hypothetical protein IT355_06575 [Gemmatimonadaceae bacterium]|nr:hypothetical protein [Gemmatimonadaceae bacterium]